MGIPKPFHKISMNHGANVSNGAHMGPASARGSKGHPKCSHGKAEEPPGNDFTQEKTEPDTEEA